VGVDVGFGGGVEAVVSSKTEKDAMQEGKRARFIAISTHC